MTILFSFLRSRAHLLWAVPAVMVSACDSTGIGNTTLQENNTADILGRFEVRAVASSTGSAANLLSNPSFDQPLGNLPGWTACVDDSSLVRSEYNGNSTVFVPAQECIVQAVTVSPGDNYTLQCAAAANNLDVWSSLGLSFYTSDYEFISEPPATLVRSQGQPDTQFKVNGSAPPSATVAVAWFYTDSGGRIDDCRLQKTPSDQPPNTQTYRKSIEVAKAPPGTYTSVGGSAGFAVNGFDSLQLYGATDTISNLIDGFDLPDQFRNSYVSVGLTDEELVIFVGLFKGNTTLGIEELEDGEFLFQDSFPATGQLWNDDSFEIYLNVGNEASTSYDDNDFLRIYGYDYLQYEPETVTGDSSRLALSNFARCYVNLDNSIGCDVAFSLAELGLDGLDTAEIGFDVHVNIDDDGGDREAKYSWCGGNTIAAFVDMSTVDCSLKMDWRKWDR